MNRVIYGMSLCVMLGIAGCETTPTDKLVTPPTLCEGREQCDAGRTMHVRLLWNIGQFGGKARLTGSLSHGASAQTSLAPIGAASGEDRAKVNGRPIPRLRSETSPHISPRAANIAPDFAPVRVLASASIAGPMLERAWTRTGAKDKRDRGQRTV